MKISTLILLILINLLGNAQIYTHNNKLMVIEHIDNLVKIDSNVVWYLDLEGNIYDYNPTVENDSIIKANQEYQIKLNNLNNKQFQELNNWYKINKQ